MDGGPDSGRFAGCMTKPSSSQGRQQRPGLLQVLGIKALGEPAVYLRKLASSLRLPALSHAQAAQAHHRPQLEEPRPLLACRLDGLEKTRFGFRLRLTAGDSRSR